ncbi:BamA/TamA family outer membrane protein [Cupriavidus pauculus]|uniref:Glyceraldehyde-3-phosphate dehydrogenase n=1 Tax=Cupriavidus pauculus TaxID=82633 RepID=A0A2N5CBM0_9BURK|nr:BamA/TamA family outer membrane protein [Cupriavidus pauculus]PLP99571.1 glyceraldehyde-3-phosphate dehydrogenase [Cupriavidus pauculus]
MMLVVALSPVAAVAESRSPSFRDPEDGAFDMSNYLLEHRGALPVPFVITEPAVGYGGGLGLLFFSESIAESEARAKERGEARAPPNITALGGAYTQNGTWAGFVGHMHSWDGDRYRYIGGLAKVNANLDYFGLGNQPRAYELDGVGLIQQLLVRMGNSKWFAGPRYIYFDANTAFKFGQGNTGLVGEGRNQRISAASLVVDYDSRDNIFFPNRGSYAEFEAQFAREGIGSTQSYDIYAARGYTWLPLSKTIILGLRADTRFSSGDVPFYVQPYVDLRGVKKAQYQDRNAISVEAELRWDFTPRWSVLGFTGMGKAYGRQSFSDAENVASVGMGFRYLLAKRLGLAVGLDVAHSKDQNAVYVQLGTAWH